MWWFMAGLITGGFIGAVLGVMLGLLAGPSLMADPDEEKKRRMQSV